LWGQGEKSNKQGGRRTENPFLVLNLAGAERPEGKKKEKNRLKQINNRAPKVQGRRIYETRESKGKNERKRENMGEKNVAELPTREGPQKVSKKFRRGSKKKTREEDLMKKKKASA